MTWLLYDSVMLSNILCKLGEGEGMGGYTIAGQTDQIGREARYLYVVGVCLP
jgi:hypothetical protein